MCVCVCVLASDIKGKKKIVRKKIYFFAVISVKKNKKYLSVFKGVFEFESESEQLNNVCRLIKKEILFLNNNNMQFSIIFCFFVCISTQNLFSKVHF